MTETNTKKENNLQTLLATTELPRRGDFVNYDDNFYDPKYYDFELPVGHLPEVRKIARAEYKKEQPIIKRLGRFAVDSIATLALVTSNPQLYLRSKEQNEQSFKTGQGINFIGRIAASRLNKMFKRGIEQTERKQVVHERAVAKYREQHPEIAEHEAKLQNELQKKHDKEYKRNTLNELLANSEYVIDSFGGNKASFGGNKAYYFSSCIPRRPEFDHSPGFTGDYATLAKQTLSSAMTYKTEDGIIPLLGFNLEQERLANHYKENQSLAVIREHETRYVKGVSTALWQLGFVQFKNEKDISYRNGNFNPSIKWEKTYDDVTARIPFDPDNELHQMLAPNQNTNARSMLELKMSNLFHDLRQPLYLNMRVIEPTVVD